MFIPHLPPKSTIVVGMSGGVDSSVTAALLKDLGFNVIGLFMKNWDEKDAEGQCTTHTDSQDVLRVADQLKIPHYTVNFVEEYREQVFKEFLTQLQLGRTPNPDILCNREIKFKCLLDAAMKMGADGLATGHYAQNHCAHGIHQLLKGVDTGKDQTYFLYTLQQSILQKVLFPVGGMVKSQVRDYARQLGLATAEKKDSTGICFIGERNFTTFLKQYLPYQIGNFETLAGKKVGTHHGIAYYTIGQRKGLGLGGEGAAWFVVDKDVSRNVVIVERGEDHPALFSDFLIAREPSWIHGAPPTFPYPCKAKIRYRQSDQECIIESMPEGTLKVTFLTPQRAITPEQSVVFYQGEVCLGGAIIEHRGPSYYECGLLVPH